MADTQEARLLRSISTLLQLFTVNEQRFPSAEGRMRYNPLDFQTLRLLAQSPGTSAADVARFLGVAPTTLQAVMDRLVRAGLVSRTTHPDSARAKAHVLTEEGNDLVAAILRQDLANMKTMLGCLDRGEREQIVSLIEKIVTGLR